MGRRLGVASAIRKFLTKPAVPDTTPRPPFHVRLNCGRSAFDLLLLDIAQMVHHCQIGSRAIGRDRLLTRVALNFPEAASLLDWGKRRSTSQLESQDQCNSARRCAKRAESFFATRSAGCSMIAHEAAAAKDASTSETEKTIHQGVASPPIKRTACSIGQP